jgi:flagellar basal-body rod modification protein FlgD
MEDKEFIAQMAQFSSLEQMTNMSSEFTELSATLRSSQAMNLIGREVEIAKGDALIKGSVEAVTNGGFPQIMVNGSYYDYDDISKVTE